MSETRRVSRTINSVSNGAARLIVKLEAQGIRFTTRLPVGTTEMSERLTVDHMASDIIVATH